jgi:hypothetical protein
MDRRRQTAAQLQAAHIKQQQSQPVPPLHRPAELSAQRHVTSSALALWRQRHVTLPVTSLRERAGPTCVPHAVGGPAGVARPHPKLTPLLVKFIAEHQLQDISGMSREPG